MSDLKNESLLSVAEIEAVLSSVKSDGSCKFFSYVAFAKAIEQLVLNKGKICLS